MSRLVLFQTTNQSASQDKKEMHNLRSNLAGKDNQLRDQEVRLRDLQVQIQRTENDSSNVQSKCERLEEENERLREENKELREQMQEKDTKISEVSRVQVYNILSDSRHGYVVKLSLISVCTCKQN